MRNKILVLAAAVAMLLIAARPAAADVQVNDIQIQPQGWTGTVRIVLINPAVDRQRGPLTMRLFIRAGGDDDWTPVKKWTDISSIAAGDKKSRTWYDGSNKLMHRLIKAGKMQAMVRITGPGLNPPVEYIKRWRAGGGGV